MRVWANKARTKCNQGPKCQTGRYTVCSDRLQATCNRGFLAQWTPWQLCFRALWKCQSLQVWRCCFSSKICFVPWCLCVGFSANGCCPWPSITAQTNSLFQFLQICHSSFFSSESGSQDLPSRKIPWWLSKCLFRWKSVCTTQYLGGLVFEEAQPRKIDFWLKIRLFMQNFIYKILTSKWAPSCSFSVNYPKIIFLAMKYNSSCSGALLSLTRNAAPKLPRPMHFISSNSSS